MDKVKLKITKSDRKGKKYKAVFTYPDELKPLTLERQVWRIIQSIKIRSVEQDIGSVIKKI